MSEQGIRTAHNKSIKPVYKHLSAKQKAIVKLKERMNRLDKDLHGYRGFYDTCPRLSNGAVAWDSITNAELDYFDRINKEYDRVCAKYNKLQDLEINEALNLFVATQYSYSQSF